MIIVLPLLLGSLKIVFQLDPALCRPNLEYWVSEKLCEKSVDSIFKVLAGF